MPCLVGVTWAAAPRGGTAGAAQINMPTSLANCILREHGFGGLQTEALQRFNSHIIEAHLLAIEGRPAQGCAERFFRP